MSGPISIGVERTTRKEMVEPEALAKAVSEHARFVFKVAYSVLRNRPDAEDAVQEAFLRAMRHARTFAAVADQRAWLARTVWRIAIDRARRRTSPSLDDVANEALLAQLRQAEARAAHLEARQSGAETLLINEQMLLLVQSLMATLPAELRNALTLSTVEEMSSREIAAVLDIPEGSVRTRVLRARKLLREKFHALLKQERRSHEAPDEH